MSETAEYRFEERGDFLAKLTELLGSGVPAERIEVLTPFHVHDVDRLLRRPTSRVRIFALAGAIAGFAAGWALTVLTALNWPLPTGGKPIVSIPAYLVIVFELTILLGALAAFSGFLLLARLPSIRGIVAPQEHDNRFIIRVAGDQR